MGVSKKSNKNIQGFKRRKILINILFCFSNMCFLKRELQVLLKNMEIKSVDKWDKDFVE